MSKAQRGPGGTRTYKNHSVIFFKTYPPKIGLTYLYWSETDLTHRDDPRHVLHWRKWPRESPSLWTPPGKPTAQGILLCPSRKVPVRASHKQVRSTPTFRGNVGGGLAAPYYAPASSGPLGESLNFGFQAKHFRHHDKNLSCSLNFKKILDVWNDAGRKYELLSSSMILWE